MKKPKRDFKYIYGPVSSWRLGVSLGVDILSTKEKTCNFNCIYCQLGETRKYVRERNIYVPTEKIIEELKSLPRIKVDYITLSGRGEPTLAKNLGQTIKAIKKLRKEPIAILTNSALIYRKDVIDDLISADFVIAKIDAYSQDSFQKINRPIPHTKFEDILKALKRFRHKYNNKLGLQIMFISQNKDKAKTLAALFKEIRPDEVQVNTPLRACPISPLSKDNVLELKKYFKGLQSVCVYECKREKIPNLSLGHVWLRRSKKK